MGRRTILLVVAVVIAALGAGMVYLYAHSADTRANNGVEQVKVLKATAQINTGETLAAAQQAGKIAQGTVAKNDMVTGAIDSTTTLVNEVALGPILPGQQLAAANFGQPGQTSTLQIPTGDIAISVSLTDTGRVAGFVSPGDNVAIFLNSSGSQGAQDDTRLLLPKVQVIAIGATTVVSQTTTDKTGAQTTEQLPNTLFTLAVNQKQAEQIMFATGHGTLNFALLDSKSKVKLGPGVTNVNLFG
ncbi:MAG: Flp pilus assembly protein CpaB [Acidimicrobiales bacterium]